MRSEAVSATSRDRRSVPRSRPRRGLLAARRAALRREAASAMETARGDGGRSASSPRAQVSAGRRASAREHRGPRPGGERTTLRSADRLLPPGARPSAEIQQRPLGKRCENVGGRGGRHALTGARSCIAEGQHVLDLGCGWGSLTLWLAERHAGIRVTGRHQLPHATGIRHSGSGAASRTWT